MKHIVPTQLLEKVLNYLAKQPFSDVADIITRIQKESCVYVEKENTSEEKIQENIS